MNYDPRFAAVCGDARLPSKTVGRLMHRRPAAQAQLMPRERNAPVLSSLHGALSMPSDEQQRRMRAPGTAWHASDGKRAGDVAGID